MIRNFSDGDMVTSGQHFLTGKAATAQGIYHRLRMFFGEYFLDISDGTAWFQSVLGKQPQDTAEAVVKQRILSSPGVVAITEFEFTSDRSGRSIEINATVLDVNNDTVQILFNEVLV